MSRHGLPRLRHRDLVHEFLPTFSWIQLPAGRSVPEPLLASVHEARRPQLLYKSSAGICAGAGAGAEAGAGVNTHDSSHACAHTRMHTPYHHNTPHHTIPHRNATYHTTHASKHEHAGASASNHACVRASKQACAQASRITKRACASTRMRNRLTGVVRVIGQSV